MKLIDAELMVFVKNFISDNDIKIPVDDSKIKKEKETIKHIAGKWLMHQREADYYHNRLIGFIARKCKKKIKKIGE